MTDAPGHDDAAEKAGRILRPLPALGVLVLLIAALAGYVAAGSALGLKSLFPGTLLLFYWAAVKHFEMRELPAATLGALGGVLNASLFVILIPVMGQGIAALCALLLLAVALYCLLVGWLPHIFNNAYMLLITVASIPEILGTGRFAGMALAVLFGAAYFGGLVGLPILIKHIQTSRSLTSS